jgi:hypothetical protein
VRVALICPLTSINACSLSKLSSKGGVRSPEDEYKSFCLENVACDEAQMASEEAMVGEEEAEYEEMLEHLIDIGDELVAFEMRYFNTSHS